MVWIIKICEVGQGRRREKSVFKLGDLCAPIEIERLGVSLEQGKALMAALQSAVVEIQAAALAEHAKLIVRSEPGVALKDYRRRRVQTVYGEVNLRVPRLDRGGIVEPCTQWPTNCRSTPELDTLRTTLSAWMSYRAAEQLLSGLIPLQGGRHHTTFRNRVLVKGATPEPTRSTDEPVASVSKMTLGLDCTFIRSHDRQKGRLHEVLIGHIEPNSGSSRVFSSIDEAGPERVGPNQAAQTPRWASPTQGGGRTALTHQLLTFCDFPGEVDVTNNGSERKLRPCVIQRKVTNGYRAMWAAQAEADVRTTIDTARLKAANPFEAILATLV